MQPLFVNQRKTIYIIVIPPFIDPQDFLYPYGTAIFIFLCAVLWLYIYLCLPETKGRSVESITIELRERTGEIQTSDDSIQHGHPNSTDKVVT